MQEFIPLSVPVLKGNEMKYVGECIETDWVSSVGKYVDQFEHDLREFVGAEHAVACVNGTAALQIALKVVGVEQGDEVIVPTVTFISSVNVINYLGAKPVFMDCDDYYNIDIQKVLEFIDQETVFKEGFSYNKKTGARISAIMPVHVFGNAVLLTDLARICKQKNIKIVEDAAESLGTYYDSFQGKKTYTGVVGDIGCYSFNGNKIITTGGGGMLVTNDAVYAQKAKYLTTQAKDDEVRYIHHEVGYNFRLTNIQAAMGVAQLEMLPEYIKIKEKNYAFYKQQIDAITGVNIAGVPTYAQSNYWMYALQVDSNKYSKSADELISIFKDYCIQVRPLWYLSHLQKPYAGCQAYKIEKALKMLQCTLNIPCSVNLSEQDIERVIVVLRKYKL
jgi:perosamine synthetase